MDLSDFKLISPMLDNFAMGAPVSEHHGVFCCPAMENLSDKKYIVKILSIPASQVQLDAFLLTGAYQNEADALEYFREQAEGVLQEADILKKLSRFEGFLPYESCQIVQNEATPGYLVYLLSPYKRSLARHLGKHVMTHLNAINLGLDLCAAMAICRRAGYLYLDLKPENIFITDDGEYRVGDLGFVKLEDLRYASLPDKYISAYTAPEVQDAFASVSKTIDIYAIGLILYQVYNDGKLPSDDLESDEPLPAPAYADYEIAEIILKACARNPEDRWQDPVEMGQAIVSYMQRNGANDVPIVPQTPNDTDETDVVDENIEEESQSELLTLAADADNYEQLQLNELKAMLGEDEDTVDSVDAAADGSEPVVNDQDDPDDPANLAFMKELVDDETAPAESMAEQFTYDELTGDTSQMLSQADELIAHETPDPVVAPEAIEVQVPPVVVDEPADDPGQEDSGASAEDDISEEETATSADDRMDDDDELEADAFINEKPKRSAGKVVGIILTIILLAGLLVGSYFFLTKYYLQPITAISLSGSEDYLTVEIKTDVDETLLTAICTDTYGNRFTSPVADGKASFTGLSANTLYYIHLDISGMHKLIGSTTASYTTPQQTNIVSFNTIAGLDEGTVIIHFTVSGVDPDDWRIVCTTEDEEDRVIAATDHTATVSGLTVGKKYRFTLLSDSSLFVVGDNFVDYTVIPLVLAEDLAITACQNGSLTAQWTVPEDAAVDLWSVRCYNENGYNKTIEVADTTAVFTDLDCTQAFNVEVIAKGMTASRRAYVTANSITITETASTITDNRNLNISWEYDGPAPENGWLLLYSLGEANSQELIRTNENAVIIKDYIPGTTYQFKLQTENGTTVFNSSFTAATPAATQFSSYQVSAANMTFKLCKTPAKTDWTRYDVPAADYTTRFPAKQKASFVISLNLVPARSTDKITALFVIRDASGNPVIHAVSEDTWSNMWNQQFCALDIPSVLPDQAGQYTIEVYFNGAAVYNGQFEILA